MSSLVEIDSHSGTVARLYSSLILTNTWRTKEYNKTLCKTLTSKANQKCPNFLCYLCQKVKGANNPPPPFIVSTGLVTYLCSFDMHICMYITIFGRKEVLRMGKLTCYRQFLINLWSVRCRSKIRPEKLQTRACRDWTFSISYFKNLSSHFK